MERINLPGSPPVKRGKPGANIHVPAIDRSQNRTADIPCVEGKAHHWRIDDDQKGVCLNCGKPHQFMHADVYGGSWDRETGGLTIVQTPAYGRSAYGHSDRNRERWASLQEEEAS